MFNFLNNISPIEIGVIIFILVMLFGGRVVASLGRATGQTVKEIKNIKKTVSEVVEDDHHHANN